MARTCLAIILLCFIAHPCASQSWEFNTSGNREGWYAQHSVSNLRAQSGSLMGDITGPDPYISGPRYPDIDAGARRFIHIRMKISSGSVAEFFWGTAAEPYHVGGREVAFGVVPDDLFHDYIIDMSANPQWTGSVNTLRLDPNEGSVGRFEVDFIRVIEVAPPLLSVSVPSAAGRFAWMGEEVTLSTTIRNDGYSAASNISATLSVAGQPILTPQPQGVSSLDPGEEAMLSWVVRAEAERVSEVSLNVTADSPVSPVRQDSQLVVSARQSALPGAAPSQAQAWLDVAGDAVIENGKVRMVFWKSAYGYGVCEVFVRTGESWLPVAASSPLSRVSCLGPGMENRHIAIAPTSVSAERIASGARLVLGFSTQDADGAWWQGSMTYTLGDRDDAVEAVYSMKCSAAQSLTAWVGPSFCAGNRGFGASKSQALLPGLEWLVGEEQSSNTLECKPPMNLRLVPHPYKITIPLMAVSGGGGLVAVLWDPLQQWNGTNRCPTARFASPNWFETQDNHLMELMLPSIPNWMAENTHYAIAKPYPLAPNAQLTLKCRVLARAGGEVLDAVDKWLEVYGVPGVPGGAGLLESGLTTARGGLMNTMWNPSEQGWPHAIGWGAEPCPEFAQDLFADSLSEPDPALKAAMRAMVDQAVQRAIAKWGAAGLGYGVGSHLPGHRLPYFVGRLAELAGHMNSEASGIRASQQADGGWFVPVNPAYPGLTTPGSKELGSCAQNAYWLLKHARVCGNSASRTAGLKALAFMNTFAIPRAAQVWEVPQHAPDILAAAWAVAAYLEGYLVAHDASYMERARYWARAGLHFVYMWRAADRQVMDYATIPVYGCTFFTIPWFGLPVQWCGMVYAYYLDRLADYDDSVPWRKIAEGIARSCIQQMNISPYAGTYGDSLNLLYSNTANPVFINPDNIYKCASRLAGRWGEVDIRKVTRATRTAQISTGGRILTGCYNQSGNQLIFRVRYPQSETCYILLRSSVTPVGVYRGAQALAKVANVDMVDEGWSYSSSLGVAVIKVVHRAEVETISVISSGVYVSPVEVAGPAEVRALPNGTTVLFRGVVSTGTDSLLNTLYVQSEDRVSGIKVSLQSPALVPFRTGARVEVAGALSSVAGERCVVYADVREVVGGL